MRNTSFRSSNVQNDQYSPPTDFKCHGNYTVYWKQQALFVEPSGCFNLEGALRLNKIIEDTVETCRSKQWTRLEIFKDINTLGPETAHNELKNNFFHSKKNGCELVCIVGGNLLMRETIIKICHMIHLSVCEVDTLRDASHVLHHTRQHQTD